MKRTVILIILFFLTFTIIIDILTRTIYCKNIHLSFDSQEFNNIASPIISFFGFIGLIVTVLITINQFKLQLSSNYFDYYRNSVNKILQEENSSSNTIQLLNFPLYTYEKYNELKKFPSYLDDFRKYLNGEKVSSNNKDYDILLGTIRLFRTNLAILLKRYELLIIEIRDHREISLSHKDLLFKELFANQIIEYISGLEFLESDQELKEVKNNLFVAFINNQKDRLLFYNSDIFILKNLIEKDDRLKKYLNNNSI